MEKKYLIVIFGLLLLTQVSAFDVESEIVNNQIYLDEQARFTLSIYNPDDFSRNIQVFTSDVKWYAETDPSSIRLEANETFNGTLRLLPSAWAEPGAQRVVVKIRDSSHDDEVQVQLPVLVKSYDMDRREYAPSVEMRVDYPAEIDPKEPVLVEVYLRNRNRLDIEALELDVQSSFFSEKRFVELGPEAERTEKFSFDVDDLTRPQEDTLEVQVVVKNKTINRERSTVEIKPYSTFVASDETTEELFKTQSIYTITNQGNVHKVDSFRVQTSFLKRFFTSTDPDPDKIVSMGDGYMEWSLRLSPYQEQRIAVTVNYRPAIYLVLIAIVISMVYFIYRSPLTLKKETIIVGSSSDGISDMKVLLHVRNRSQDLIENITVTDMIPSIAGLVKEKHMGTMAPSKVIKHQKKGTIIKWSLDALEPFEERIISYRIKSKITIVGGFTLPAARVSFTSAKGKERAVRSNKSQISVGI